MMQSQKKNPEPAETKNDEYVLTGEVSSGILNTVASSVIKAVSVVIPAAKGLLKFTQTATTMLTLIKFFLIAIVVLLALIFVAVVASILV